MNITFLGTGTSQGVPVIGCECEVCRSIDYRDKRLRSSIFIRDEDLHIVIDTGPDFRQQMLRERIKTVDAVLYTHAHKDHTAGMDDVRGFNLWQKKEMPLYGQFQALEQLKIEFSYAFSQHKYPGTPNVSLHPIENSPFELGHLRVTPIEVMHYKLQVFGYRVKDFTYITDANYISDEEKNKIKGSKVVVINALQRTKHISHFTLAEALELIEEIQPEQAFLTHISHNMGIHSEVAKELPENVQIAYDGLKLAI